MEGICGLNPKPGIPVNKPIRHSCAQGGVRPEKSYHYICIYVCVCGHVHICTDIYKCVCLYLRVYINGIWII